MSANGASHVTKYGQNLKGKVALVTGSGRGIGAGAAIRLAEHGADVVINYFKSSKSAEEVANKCRDLGVKATVVQADVTKAAEVEQMFETAKKELGRIDIVFSNAGIEHWGDPSEVDEAQIDELFNCNYKAQWFVSKAAWKHMEDNGRIILMSSISAQLGIGRHALYASTKAAVQAMARCFAVDFAPRKITVNVIAPGGIKTDMYASHSRHYIPGGSSMTEEEIDVHVGRMSPMKRPGTVDDTSGVIAMLASEEAAWLTGQVIHCSGGARM